MAGLSSAIGAGASILNATNSYGTSSSYGYNLSDAIQASSSRLYGSQASAEDILRAQEANEMQKAFMEAQQAFNSAEAEKQRKWEEAMSNTAYQRAVTDMIKAGINPIIAFQNGGASTPAGSSASAGMQTAYKAQTFADQESNSSGKSSSKGENWSSSVMASMTQLMDGLGDIISGLGSAIVGATSGLQASANQYLQDAGLQNKEKGTGVYAGEGGTMMGMGYSQKQVNKYGSKKHSTSTHKSLSK